VQKKCIDVGMKMDVKLNMTAWKFLLNLFYYLQPRLSNNVML